MSIQKSFILSFLVLVTFNFMTAQNLYVSKNGVDDTSDPTRGYSLQKAFKTIDFAAKEKAQPGDTIFVKRGNYYNENFGDNKTDIYSNEKTVNINDVHGKRNKYIVIMPYNNERVVFRGDGSVIFQVRKSSYIKVQGFIIIGEVKNIPLADARKYQFKYLDKNGVERSRIGNQNLTDAQIANLKLDKITESITRPTYFDTKGLLVQSSHHIIIENNNISFMPGTGLRFQACDDFVCTDNTVNNCSRRSAVGTHGLVVHSLKSRGTSNAVKVFIERNKVHNNYNELYSWSIHKEFIKTEIDEGKGISMQKNYAANGWKNGRVVIRNNITYRNGLSGIHINQGERMDIINNVSFRNHFYGQKNNIGISVSNGKQINLYNNISVADDTWGGNAFATDNSTEVKAAHNLYVGQVDAEFAALDNKLIAVTDEPLFANSSKRDFSLVSGSPAINSGLERATPNDDFFGNNRDNRPDIGAIDYKGTGAGAKILNDFTPLFEILNMERQAKKEASEIPEIKRISYVKLKQNARNKQFQVIPNQQFNLFSDVQINIQLEKSTRQAYKDLEVYTGRTQDARFAHLPQYKDAVVVFNPRTNKMTASIANDQGRFQISPIANSDTYKVIEFWNKPIDCKELHLPESEQAQANPAAARMATCEDIDADGNYVIDLFVGFSDAAAAEIVDMDAHAQTLITMVNNGLTNSLVNNVYMRLVGTGTNPENPGIVTSVLDDVYDWYSLELQKTGADFIAAVQKPTGAEGEALGWAAVGAYSSVNSIYDTDYVFRHEMGHSIGGGHCAGDGSITPYAHGYDNGNTSTHLCGNDINFYSNPNVLDAEGLPLGDAATADMARVWRERAEEMASRNYHQVAIGANDGCITHCKPTHFTVRESITKVELNTINQSSGSGTSEAAVNYSDFSNITTSLQIGTGYNLTVNANSSWASSNLNVWIDWNQNLLFEENELVTSLKSAGPWTNTITPPTNATLGAVIMRVRLQYGSNNSPHPCYSTGYGGGETEDYTLNILPNTSCNTVVLNTTDFDNGWGIWNDGGVHCRKNKKDAPYASSGEFCIRLKNKGEEAVMTTDVLDLSAYENLTVDFGYQVRSFEKVEDFWLQLSTDGGSTFTTMEEWNLGDEFNNDEFKTAQVNMAGPFTDNTVLRFRCNASGNGDWVYIDDVSISGCTLAAAANSLIVKEASSTIQETPIELSVNNDFDENKSITTELKVFPNPFSDNLTIQTNAKEWFVFTAFGQLVQQGIGDETTTSINLGDLPAGVYFVKADRETVKVIKQ